MSASGNFTTSIPPALIAVPPKVSTQNNQTAVIEQGVQIPVVNTTATEINVEIISSSLRLEVTPQITREGTVIMVVKVDNSAVNDIPPLTADFTFFGGMYRDVNMYVVDPLHIDLDDMGASGVYVTPTNVTSASVSFWIL